MQHSPKYVIHADIRTSGVVERSDVVGAIYGQTEGLLGEDLDLRDLQESSKVGRIDVDIDSEGGRTFGTVTIASGLDRAETAVLAAALETIERVGPCRSTCEVIKIEDARAAKRRQIVDRATELLASFEAEALTSDRLVDEVRERVRESELTEFHGLPAGPRVADSDAIIVVEGRADVRQLLSYGVKNAIAVEGTDIPEPVARLTAERTTTAFLDGDRGGDLVLRELAQVGDIDYVAFAPSGQSVEDLDRGAVMGALRKKLPYEQVSDGDTPREAFAPTDGGTVSDAAVDPGTVVECETPAADQHPEHEGAGGPDSTAPATDPETRVREALDPVPADVQEGNGEAPADDPASEETAEESDPDTVPTLADHVTAVVAEGADVVRLLDGDLETLTEAPAEEAFDAVESAPEPPATVVLDGAVSQRLLDVAAQRGVGRIVAAETGEFVKQPVNVRVHTAEEIGD
jgi:DNA primase